MRVLAPLSLLALALLPACTSARRAPLDTPDAPAFDDVRAARDGQAIHAAPDVARALGARLRAYGLQPVTRLDRRLALGGDTLAAAFVAGKDPLRANYLIVVAVRERAGPAALGGFLELARLMAHLARYYVIPEPTLLFAALPEGRELATLGALRRAPTWPADSARTVVQVGGGSSERHVFIVPEQSSAGATARSAYAALKILTYGHRARADSLAAAKVIQN